MFVEIHEYLAARKTNTMALADRYAFIKSEIEALGKELEKVRFEIKQTGVERLVGERAIVLDQQQPRGHGVSSRPSCRPCRLFFQSCLRSIRSS